MKSAMVQRVLDDVERGLRSAFAGRLRGVVLYGSQARGDATEDSDIDVLVLLDGPIELDGDLALCVDAVFPVSLECGRPISAKPADVDDYEAGEYPLYRAAKAEGIRR